MIRRSWLVLGLVACGAPEEIPKEDFPSAGADVICDRMAECARGQYDAAFFGSADCRAEFERDLGDLVDLNDAFDCDYDPREAAAAWIETREMSCEDFYEGEYLTAAEDIWGDCGGFDVDF